MFSAFSVAVTESHELGSTEGKRIINHVVLETQGAPCQNIWHLSGEVFLLGHDMAEDVTRQGSIGLFLCRKPLLSTWSTSFHDLQSPAATALSSKFCLRMTLRGKFGGWNKIIPNMNFGRIYFTKQQTLFASHWTSFVVLFLRLRILSSRKKELQQRHCRRWRLSRIFVQIFRQFSTHLSSVFSTVKIFFLTSHLEFFFFFKSHIFLIEASHIHNHTGDNLKN